MGKAGKFQLKDQVPEYGLEALVSTIDSREELLAALRAMRKKGH